MSTVLPALEFVATLAGALFAGAALYINVAEHPARMGLETRMAALQWAPSYQRATWLQAPLALLSLTSGVADEDVSPSRIESLLISTQHGLSYISGLELFAGFR